MRKVTKTPVITAKCSKIEIEDLAMSNLPMAKASFTVDGLETTVTFGAISYQAIGLSWAEIDEARKDLGI